MESDTNNSIDKEMGVGTDASMMEPADSAAGIANPMADRPAFAQGQENTDISRIATDEERRMMTSPDQLQQTKQVSESRIRMLVSKPAGFFSNVVPRAKEYFSETERLKHAAGRIGAVAAIGGIGGALALNKTRHQDRKTLRIFHR